MIARTRVRSRDAGFTLVETLMTVVIVGITFAIFVGGMGTAVLTSDYHRKHANARAAIRNFAEAVKAAPYDQNCATAAASYASRFAPPSPTRDAGGTTAFASLSHVAPSVDPVEANSRLISLFSLANGSTFSAPPGMTSLWGQTSANATTGARVTVHAADAALTSAAPTGPKTATSATAGDSAAHAVLLESATGAANSIVRRGSTSAAGTAVTTLAIPKPASTASGDAMVAQVAVRSGDAIAVTAPLGWELVDSRAVGTSLRSLIYQRAATTSSPETFTWSFDSAQEVAGGIVAYGGVSAAFSVAITDFKVWNGAVPATDATFVSCAASDFGLQRVSLRVRSLDDRAEETLVVLKRDVRDAP